MFEIVKRLVGVAVIASVFVVAPAYAGIRVLPMAYDLTPAGPGSQQDLRVENTGDSSTPVEITVERREIFPDGTEKRTPADDDFLIFPPQGIVPSKGFQTFRVKYIGPAVEKTVLYVVTIAQLPVEVDPDKNTGVQLLFSLGTLAAVSPPDSKPKLVVTNVAPSPTAGMLRVTVENEGTRYARLRNGKWTFKPAHGKEATLEGEALAEALKQPLIEPGTTRIVDLPVPGGFDRSGATAAFALADQS